MKKYKVRYPFVVKLSNRVVHQAGEVIELDDAQAELHILKIEEVFTPKVEKPKATVKVEAK